MDEGKDHQIEEPAGDEAGEEIARKAVELRIALNAATINIHMYPPTSDMIAASVDTAYGRMDPLLAQTGKLTLGEADNLLLVNGEKLHDRDQVRLPVLSFLDSLRRRDIYSITFSTGMEQEEFLKFLYIMAKEPEELRQLGGMAASVPAKRKEFRSRSEMILRLVRTAMTAILALTVISLSPVARAQQPAPQAATVVIEKLGAAMIETLSLIHI